MPGKKLSCQHLGGNFHHLRLPIGTPFWPPRDLHPTNHSPRAVRHPWGKCPNDLGEFLGVWHPCQRKNADIPQKWEKGHEFFRAKRKKQVGNLVSKLFWDVFGACWNLDSLFSLKKKTSSFSKKELEIKTLKDDVLSCPLQNESFLRLLTVRTPRSILPHPEDPFIWWSNAYICLSSHHLLKAGFTFCWKKKTSFGGERRAHPHSWKLWV